MIEQFESYLIRTTCTRKSDGRYSVGAAVGKTIEGNLKEIRFDDVGISLILETEAMKEAVNFGKNLISKGLVPF